MATAWLAGGSGLVSRTFYGAVKGETERDAARVGFPSVYALRPSILDGDRGESRHGEYVGLLVGRVLAPPLGKHGPTPVGAVVEPDTMTRRQVSGAKFCRTFCVVEISSAANRSSC
jgi:hypothetical protein